ncbi:hypothetical protein [Cupriavidus sp. SW-Y-13]|uniref:hypothetical protein n=1 Tax=Cupriavidus sp. SW-Y-13 TaxID=2653854 RepID=UPI0013659E3E|nr:hypothetical protein [Cupriavidus sp. SW-Y-13]MWL89584.1 hypothetical protein [Cupriavidus sp. SW-Y-13]
MKKMFLLSIFSALGLSTAVLAQAQPDIKTDVTRSPGQATATGMVTATAVITAIDAANRKLSLKTPQGKTVEMTVGPEARNFEQLKLGDKVTVSYREALTVSLKKGSGAASMKEKEISERSQPGERPGGTVGREVTVVSQVVAVNREAQTITVKGPRGNLVDLKVNDPDHMTTVKKGDRVQAVYTEAVAVSVAPASEN